MCSRLTSRMLVQILLLPALFVLCRTPCLASARDHKDAKELATYLSFSATLGNIAACFTKYVESMPQNGEACPSALVKLAAELTSDYFKEITQTQALKRWHKKSNFLHDLQNLEHSNHSSSDKHAKEARLLHAQEFRPYIEALNNVLLRKLMRLDLRCKGIVSRLEKGKIIRSHQNMIKSYFEAIRVIDYLDEQDFPKPYIAFLHYFPIFETFLQQ